MRIRHLTSALVLASSATAQTLCPSSDALGGSLTYDLAGPSGQLFALLLSQTQGPTPLAIIDPADPRMLEVGLDLLPYVQSGLLIGGTAQVSLPLPPNPGLHGVTLYAQFVTIPGATTLVDLISERGDVVLGNPAAPHSPLGSLTESRQALTLTRLQDGRMLIAGGDRTDGQGSVVQALDTWELFDPCTLTFEQSPNTLPAPRATHTATALQDGRVLLLGGYTDPDNPVAVATGEIYDPATDTASAITPMPEPRSQHTATLLQDGRVFVAGGTAIFDLAQPLVTLGATHASTRLYDPATNTWTLGPALPERLMGHNASLMNNGRVMITAGVEVQNVFGLNIPSFSTRCQRYNPATNALLPTSSIPGGGGFAYHSQVTLSGGKVVVAGGADGNLITLQFTPRTSVYRYETGADVWTQTGSLNFGRAYGELLQVGNKLLMLGGLKEADLVTHYGTPEDRIESSPTALTGWTHAPSMTTILPRELLRAAAFDGGDRVLILGAGDDGTAAADVTAEVYQP